ncbi:dihydropteroate synthase [Desulfonatronum sp. SC1]|uniref:dihydropteroate synthase n=1 Tax=Desulfonatronum sp. SC1 TaxID=2109626 RepID=UPI000D311E21|nr:dihydropteroate synthase [Desulfonatronum sp. SC1]PTN34940.1 dihydropteroate synthase [Desulfonatronum sp. SC1]
MRPVSSWRIKDGGWIDLSNPVIMGVVNCTPDSFYDGGRYDEPGAALRHGLLLASQGAMILDVGGESTRPGSRSVSVQEELERVLPVVCGLSAALPPTPPDAELSEASAAISIDTTKSAVAARCLQGGASIVNDVSGCRFDPELLDVLGQFRPGYVLMHAQGRPESMQEDPRYNDVVDTVRRFFEQRLDALARSGLPEEHVVLDPGIGFGKRLEHNLELLRNIEVFQELGRPILVGISNKSLWKGLMELELEERGTVSQVAAALLAARGVRIHRMHDVSATARTLRVERALRPEGVPAC